MNKPQISVIVPVYNVEKYLDRCIQSILNQTLKEIEIILVDDESSDRCPQLCDDYAQKYTNIYVIHKKNAGLGMARNSGIALAQGEYVCFVDSDDFIEKEMLECLYHECITHKLDAIYTQFNTSNYPGYKVIPREEKIYVGKQEIDELRLDMIGPEPSYTTSVKFEASSCLGLYLLSILKNHNISFASERKYISEDLLFNLKFLSCSERIKIVPWQFYHYCLNEQSLTHVYRADRWSKLILMLKTIPSYMEDLADKTELERRLARTAMTYARMVITINLQRKDIGFTRKLKEIKSIIIHPVLQQFIQDYPFKDLPIKWKILGLSMKWKLSYLIYILFCIKNN